MKISVRSYQPEDWPRLEEITTAAWSIIFESQQSIIGMDMFNLIRPAAMKQKIASLRSVLDDPDCGVVTAVRDDGFVVGFATYRLDRSRQVGVVGLNAVDHLLHLKGVGQMLYAELMKRFRAAGMIAAQVTTGLDEAHAPARRAYARAGFDVEHSIQSLIAFRKL